MDPAGGFPLAVDRRAARGPSTGRPPRGDCGDWGRGDWGRPNHIRGIIPISGRPLRKLEAIRNLLLEPRRGVPSEPGALSSWDRDERPCNVPSSRGVTETLGIPSLLSSLRGCKSYIFPFVDPRGSRPWLWIAAPSGG